MIQTDKVTFMVFVDFEKAYEKVYEKVYGEAVKNSVRVYSKKKAAQISQGGHEGGRARVKVEEMESQWFSMYKGVGTGCTLLPWLLNVFGRSG